MPCDAVFDQVDDGGGEGGKFRHRHGERGIEPGRPCRGGRAKCGCAHIQP
jgi:hypothetical protein